MSRLTVVMSIVGALLLGACREAVADSGVRAPQQVKPTHTWCPTNRTCFSHVHWSIYRDDLAVGRGEATECAGGGGPCRTHRSLKVTLYRTRVTCGARRFTRMRLFGYVFALDRMCQSYMR